MYNTHITPYAYARATYPAFQPLPEASPQRSNVLQLTTLHQT